MTQGIGAIFCSFLLAYILEVIAVPEWAEPVRPCWTVLVLLYWVIAVPHRVGVIGAWFAGLFLDVVQGNVLGQNAFALALVAYVTYVLHMRIRVFPVWQQSLSIIVLVGVYQLVTLLIQRSVHITPWTMSYWMAAIMSGLCWPWVLRALSGLRRRYRVD
ncbi:MAG: rod shape-determining protein MreD [Gammaproteobacteria bacterium]|nr:MAG: rod shape-determining protein MreD [Gammaproteobacteria bacterium]